MKPKLSKVSRSQNDFLVLKMLYEFEKQTKNLFINKGWQPLMMILMLNFNTFNIYSRHVYK